MHAQVPYWQSTNQLIHLCAGSELHLPVFCIQTPLQGFPAYCLTVLSPSFLPLLLPLKRLWAASLSGLPVSLGCSFEKSKDLDST